ncbi:MAG: tetratricopeptide repeat protein [Candidatus Lambdaproteobacteria bacterium]|nr:tetratricopeptide repeat protein [Candidatus Lambdaproteobacteria bacterium]
MPHRSMDVPHHTPPRPRVARRAPAFLRPARRATLRPRLAPALLALLLLAAWRPLPAAGQTPAGGQAADSAPAASSGDAQLDQPPAAIESLQLRKAGGGQQLHFLMTGNTPVSIVGNARRQVVVVKFEHARATFAQGQRVFAFNDPFIEGVVFDEVAPNVTWAKVRLRDAQIAFQRLAEAPKGQVVVAFMRTPPPQGALIKDFRLNSQPDGTTLVLEASAVPAYEDKREGNFFLVRIKSARAELAQPLSGGDERVQLVALDQDGEDLLLRVQLKQGELHAVVSTGDNPARLEVRFTPAAAPAPATAEAQAEPRLPPEVPGSLPRPPPRGESLEELLEGEPSPVVRANYILAEREFRGGRYDSADSIFMRVYQASPRTRLGIRSFFRAADSQYALVLQQGGRNFHRVINNYQAAIRAAETANYDSDLIPAALFQVGRSYQRMGFDYEANVNYQILQERFADNTPYTPDSYFFRGQTFLGIRQYEEAIGSFQAFLQREGDPALIAAAYYHMGDTFYNLKSYPDAKAALDKGREIDPDYPNTRPVLLFHMGEAYYENADFDVARLLYRTLLERYPEKPYTKLVALRLGDFLRDEGKEDDALEIYNMVIKGAPLPIRLRGKLRIANLLVQRPAGDDYKTGVRLYDEVIREGQGGPVAEEAGLRKALALTLHNRFLEAVGAFEALARDFPNSPFVRPNIVRANIEENLKAKIDEHFAAREYWEIAKVYTRYRDTYFPDFRFKFTLFQVANAYQHLGLYDEAIHLYQKLLDAAPGDLRTLVEYRQAAAYAEKDDLVQSEEALLRFIQQHQADIYLTDVRMKLGQVYLSGRRYADALNAFRIMEQDFQANKDPRLNEAAGEVYYALGVIYKELGQLKDSAESFRAAVQNFHHPIQGDHVPDYIVLSHFLEGDALFELQQDQEAIAAYEKAIGLYPSHDKAPWARYQIGLIYRRNGEERRALDTFNQLLELARTRPGELWESLARENQRDLVNALQYKDYLSR